MAELNDPTVTDVEAPKPLAVSITEAGHLLGVSRDLVYDMVARHELGSVRLGRRIVVPLRAIEAILVEANGEADR